VYNPNAEYVEVEFRNVQSNTTHLVDGSQQLASTVKTLCGQVRRIDNATYSAHAPICQQCVRIENTATAKLREARPRD
jgi:lysyl-tRNA synthetase class I